MAENMFNRPPRRQGGIDTFARALQGFGAGLEGRGAEFFAAEDQRQQQLDERRQKAMARDAMRVYSQLNDGKYDDALELIDDRVKSINELGGDASDTLEIRNLIVSGRLDEAQQELGGFLELAMQNGLIEAPKAPEIVPASSIVNGQVVTRDFDAEMARINQPTTQAQPAPVTDIGRINRAVQTGEITPEQGDAMLNAAIQKQEIELATGQAKVDETANRDQMILGEMTRLYDLSGSLLANKSGLARSTGPVSARMPTLRQDASDFKADLEEFRNLLTMSNLGRMTGVLSESDIRLIASASSGISETASEERMREKIIAIRERIIPKLIAAGVLPSDGSAPMGNVPPIPSQYQGMITDSEWQAMTPEERAAF
jgi:hypothetical protein